MVVVLGFVVVDRFVVDLLEAAGFFDRTRGFFPTVVGFFVVVLRDPDVTRLECFVRCRTVLAGAASAIELRAKVATRATSSILIVLRIIDSSVTVR